MKYIKKKLIPKFIKPYIDIYRELGFSGLIKKGGYKLLITIIIFYLIRDTILYVIPFLMVYYGMKNI